MRIAVGTCSRCIAACWASDLCQLACDDSATSGKSPIHSSRRLVPGSPLVGSDLRACRQFWGLRIKRWFHTGDSKKWTQVWTQLAANHKQIHNLRPTQLRGELRWGGTAAILRAAFAALVQEVGFTVQLEARVDGFTLQRENSEHALVHAAQRFVPDETLQCFDS